MVLHAELGIIGDNSTNRQRINRSTLSIFGYRLALETALSVYRLKTKMEMLLASIFSLPPAFLTMSPVPPSLPPAHISSPSLTSSPLRHRSPLTWLPSPLTPITRLHQRRSHCRSTFRQQGPLGHVHLLCG
jgi:hypothetical protein